MTDMVCIPSVDFRPLATIIYPGFSGIDPQERLPAATRAMVAAGSLHLSPTKARTSTAFRITIFCLWPYSAVGNTFRVFIRWST